MQQRRSGATEQELADTAVGICAVITDFNPTICRGTVDMNVEAMVFIIDSRPALTATQFCGFVLQGECGDLDPMFSFTVNVSPGPTITAPKSVAAPRSPDELKIIHITDIHYDENYMAGGFGQCPNPVCCRRSDGVPTNPAHAAGVWGDFRVWS